MPSVNIREAFYDYQIKQHYAIEAVSIAYQVRLFNHKHSLRVLTSSTKAVRCASREAFEGSIIIVGSFGIEVTVACINI